MSRNRPESELQAFVHKTNVERYKKLLQTNLTDRERAFIRRRVDEELAQLHTIDAM
jgi:hypothetical protein